MFLFIHLNQAGCHAYYEGRYVTAKFDFYALVAALLFVSFISFLIDATDKAPS